MEMAMMRTPQAAAYLGIAPATLAKWRVLGGGPRYHKLGRAVVYDPGELASWAQERARNSTADGSGRGAARGRSKRGRQS